MTEVQCPECASVNIIPLNAVEKCLMCGVHFRGKDAISSRSADSSTYPPLAMVEWIDTTNIAAWTNLDEIADWAPDGGFICRNVGYLVHEDADCVVLAARTALEAEPKQVGLFERIPRGVIRNFWRLTATQDDSGLLRNLS